MEQHNHINFDSLINDYFDTLNELDEKRRMALIQRVWATEGTFVSPFGNVRGHSAINDLIGSVHKQIPQSATVRTTEIEVLQTNYLRFNFEVRRPDNTALVSGVDFATIENGKLKLVAGFADAAQPSDKTLTHQEIVSTVKHMYQAFNSGAVATWFTFFAPTFEWHAADNSPIADHSPYCGLNKVRDEVLPRLASLFPGMQLRIDEIIATDNKAVMLGYYYNLRRKEGGTTEAQVAHILTFENSKIIKFQQYLDTYKFASL